MKRRTTMEAQNLIGSSGSSRSYRRRRHVATCASSPRVVCYGIGLVLLSLSSSSRGLTPASPTRMSTTLATALYAKGNPLKEPLVEDFEFTVPVEWDADSSGEFSERRKRQYKPAATERTVLQMASEQLSSSPHDINQEFELHVGRALDTLRQDYPNLLTACPDLSIYDRNIEVVDPSGVKVHGLKTYQNSFRLLHALVKFLYCPSQSTMSFRMCFDKARRNIRIHWNAAVVPREFFGGSRQTLHVDGISVYELDFQSGNIVQHRIEQLLMNNMPVRPKEGVIAALRDEHRVTVPSFFKPSQRKGRRRQPTNILRFQPAGLGRSSSVPSSLFAMEASEPDENSASEAPNSSSVASFDLERFEAKNKSRKKFGLKPLTEDEFMEIELQVKQLDAEQKQRAQAMTQAAATTKQEKQRGSFVEKLFGNVLKDTCESNWDCERPEVCCDFGFKKMCCSSGSLVANGVPQLALVPVPVDVGPPRNPEPRNY